MPLFGNDYLAGCHPAILERLADTNLEQTPGYGLDPYCESARAKIRAAIGSTEADVHFLVGGTQTNATVIAHILRPHQGVIAAEEAHIFANEAGAIEATGHKVLALPSADGKLGAQQVQDFIEKYYTSSNIKEHIVQPGMVYITQPTELGTVYSRAELAALAQVCRHHSLPLFVDGARLGYALHPNVSDVTLADLAALTDAFYIGGTKCGALFGEAVVITNDVYKPHFRAMMKQRGGLLAKGRLLGIQFDTLFTDNLYQTICHGAIAHARHIRQAFEARGIPFYGTSATNQQFPILPEAAATRFIRDFGFAAYWPAENGRQTVRYCTSWATTEADVATLLRAIESL
ncbi:aminotransferase class I/II-fold pyridoxal phosphate-dependent enzyme [Eikenella sp. S3360]|uniref:Aminotransferase class I/II-fold pyridoxal phosphate-dependent enzyme n=2 Tax=Eikenella glucosivorans TaxID=2766967 RepID=A0ABS0NC40_9NEIS|nr:aminotransferase class I/II-fold pyridoxal phosphate-dependent enzyme [Eikenella glucosivorans]